jgi:hypothetical protein
VGVLDYTSTSAPNSLDFAVSNDADATHGFTEMHKVSVGEGSFFADYPREGINADAYFVTFNMFSTTTGAYDHPQIFTIQKSTVIDQNNSTLTTFHHDYSNLLFTLAPANMHGASTGGPEYFVTEAANVGQIDVIKETNVLSNTPTDVDNNINVASYSQPPNAPEPGGGTFTVNDSRVLNSSWRGNILVAAQTVGTGSPQEAHARWYQFNTSSTPTLTQYGEINPGSGVATFFPSVDIDANNDIGMTYMESSSSEYVSMYVTARTPTDATGTMETAVDVAAGTVSYAGSRGGDFSGTSVDPSTGTSFWSANEYIPSGPLWSTYVAQYSVGGGVDHLSVAAPSSATAGSAFTVTVTALNSSNGVDTGFHGMVHFASSDGQAGLPSDYTFTTGDAGVHTFTNLTTLKTAGSQTLTASDTTTGATSGTATVTVNPGAASKLSFGTQPGNSLTGQPITPAPTVRVLDAYGNLETGDNSDSITMAIGTNPGGGTLSGTNPVTVSAGVATFSNLSINNPGNGYTLVASSGSLSSATSNAFNETAPSATHYTVTAPSSATAGSAFTVTVTALDANNHVATSYTGTVHFSSSDTQAGLPANYTFSTGDAGVHTFTNAVTLKTAGSKGVTSTDTVNSSITGSASVTVNPAAANHLAFSQQPTNTNAGSIITPAVTVQVFDAYGNLETGDNTDSVTIAIGTNPAGGTLSGTTTVTVSGGVATFSNLSINNAGNGYTLVATSGSLASATSNAFNITAATAKVIEGFESGPSDLNNYFYVGNFLPDVTITTGAAHDGVYGLNNGGSTGDWIFRNDSTVIVNAGDTISWWVKIVTKSDGRAYCGFAFGNNGGMSVVLAPNTGQFIIQDNTNFGFTQLAAVNQSYSSNTWYRVEADWSKTGIITAKLFSSNGTTQLNSVVATDTSFSTGGIGFRATGHHKYFDTVTDTPGVNVHHHPPLSVSQHGVPSAAWQQLAIEIHSLGLDSSFTHSQPEASYFSFDNSLDSQAVDSFLSQLLGTTYES